MAKKYAAAALALLLFWGVFLSSRLPASAREEVLRLPAVMYHHISADPRQWNDYVVSLEEFTADLDYLSAHGWQAVSVRNLLDWYDGHFEMPEKPFLLTFDDGFESTLAYAEPLLARYGFCGVAAVIGSVCEKFSLCGEHDPEYSNLSWEDAAGMAARGVVEIQCHTWDMHALSPRKGCRKKSGESPAAYRSALAADLARFRSEAQAHGLPFLPAIAYPYGAFSPETGDVVRAAGFRLAFTCDERVNLLTGGETETPLRLGRFNRPHGPASAAFFAPWEENSPDE